MKAFAAFTLPTLLSISAVAQGKGTIERLNQAFEAAFNKGDSAAVANMYAHNIGERPKR